jgi:hypothetical protein
MATNLDGSMTLAPVLAAGLSRRIFVSRPEASPLLIYTGRRKKSYSDFSFFKSYNRIGSSTFFVRMRLLTFCRPFFGRKKKGVGQTQRPQNCGYFVCVTVVN